MAVATTARDRVRPRALSAPTLCAAFQLTATEHADRVALRTRSGATELTWGQYSERVRRLAAGLAGLGVGHGDSVGLMLTNRPEFHLLDCAAMHLGAVCFSVYNTSAPEQIQYVVADAANTVLLCERQFADRVLEVASGGRTAIEHVVVIDEPQEGTLSLEDLEAAGDAGFDFDTAWKAVQPDDLLTLIYTSGTTGPPKGVQVSHANMLAEWRALDPISRVEPGGRAVSYLPAAHIADRWASHYGPMVFAMTITCCPDARELFEHVVEVRPTFFGGVPRIWEKLKAALEVGIEHEPDEAKRQATRWAIDVGTRRVRAEQAGTELDPQLLEECAKADELVLSKIRERLGLEDVDWFVSGAAPIPVEVLEFFAALGIGVCELWGMSETTCVATLNPRERIKIGTVGPALPGVEVKLADDGEVLVRGPIVMRGYRNMPERTAETFDADGWLHSGDIGALDDDGYLSIVDRKKELIINAAGKNMSPANIEAALKSSSPLIGQAIAIGDRRPYNAALIVLDPDNASAFATQHGLADASVAAMGGEPKVLEEVAAGVQRANAKLSRVEQIKRFKLLDCDWEAGGDELTPTMKLKRKPIAEKYAAEIEALYA
jgi:long-subunit acyl-CoA synthetase (AMP-forming)